MADHFCSFLDFRPLSTNSNLNVLLLHSKRCYASALAHSYNSRINGFMKRSPLHRTLLSKMPSCSNFDVISTHEHPDGSLLFRFGDPSEVAKNATTEESNFVKEEAGIEGRDGYIGINDLDVNHKADMTINTEDRSVTGLNMTEVGDETNSAGIASKSTNFVEGEDSLNENLSGGANDIELLVSIANENPSGVANNVRTEEFNAVKEELAKTEVCSVGDETTISSKSIDVVEGETELKENLSEGLNDIVIELPIPVINEEMEVGVYVEDARNLDKGVDKKHVDSCSVDPFMLDESSEEENTVSNEEFTKNETDGLATLVVDVPDSDVFPESLECVVRTDESHKNLETEVISEIDESGGGSAESDLVSSHPSLESDINPSEVIDDQNLQAQQKSIIGKDGESGMNDHMSSEVQNVMIVNENECEVNDADADPVSNSTAAEGQASEAGIELPCVIDEDIQENGKIESQVVSPQLEAEPLEATGTDTMEESTEANGAASLKLDLTLGTASSEVDNNVQNCDLAEASSYEVMGSPTRSEEIPMSDLVLSSAAALLPHPSKALAGGEDAYFIAGQTWLGVANGTGHWSLEGTRPGVFAKELTRTCERLVSDCNVNNLVELLDLSVAETHSPGSSTILIAHFDGQVLHVANVGDSGFIILRHGTVYKKSSPMFHAFHFPLQVERGDQPSRLAEFYAVELEESDVIIIATDGLLDNLYDQEILSVITRSLAADEQLEEIAEVLVQKAQEIGGRAYGRSPFADYAQAAGYVGYTGGRLDDVAVIISVVRRRQSATESSY